MSTLKKTLMKQGLKFMSNPRVMKLMQDPRVMKAVMTAMSMPTRVESFSKEQVEKIAKAMALVTEHDVDDLKRTIRKLEEEVARLQKEKDVSREVANARRKTSAPD